VQLTQIAQALAWLAGAFCWTRVREHLRFVVGASAQRIHSRTAQARRVLEIRFGGVETKRVPVADTLVHEIHTNRLAMYPDAGEAGLGCCFDCHHAAPVGYSVVGLLCKGHCPVLSIKSSKSPGGIARSPDSHCCQARIDALTVLAASV